MKPNYLHGAIGKEKKSAHFFDKHTLRELSMFSYTHSFAKTHKSNCEEKTLAQMGVHYTQKCEVSEHDKSQPSIPQLYPENRDIIINYYHNLNQLYTHKTCY